MDGMENRGEKQRRMAPFRLGPGTCPGWRPGRGGRQLGTEREDNTWSQRDFTP